MVFIDTLESQQSPPPFAFPGMVLRNFLLEADQAKLQQYCDTFLNIMPGEQYFEVLSPYVFLSVNTYPKMLLEGHENLGYSSQDEYFLMLPVLRYAAFGTILLPREITWVFPFIGVNNPTSAIAGQTVLGFPKLCGTITPTIDAAGAFSAGVAMPGFATLAPDSAQQVLPIVSIATGAPLTDAAAATSFPWTLFDHDDLRSILSEVVLALLDLIAAAPGLFSVTTMKQIRSATQPAEADVQQLLRGEWQLSDLRAPVAWDGATITITDNATTRIAATLGIVGDLQPGGALQAQALSAYSLTTDMRFADFTALT